MITTVTVNAALDSIYQVPALQMNTVHRVNGITVPGGKGINAARIMRLLDEPVTAAGFAAGYNGQKMIHLLKQEQVDCRFTEAAGETRLAITVLDPQQQTQTEFIESGPLITSEQLIQLEQTITELAAVSDWMLFSGSLPPGCPDDLYARLIRIAREYGARTALDSSGHALHEGIKAAPDLVKPNEQEAYEWAGVNHTSFDRKEKLKRTLSAMLEQGTEMAAISLGADGAVAAKRTSGAFYRVHIPKLDIISALGSGDAMAAGMVTAASRGGSLEDMLSLGSACGCACALQPAAGMLDMDDVRSIQSNIEITAF